VRPTVSRFDMPDSPHYFSFMVIPSGWWPRCGRALFVALALVANLFATSAPLLHVLAHEHAEREGHGHGHRHDHPGDRHAGGGGEDHDEVHPASLHDEYLVVPRAALDFTYVLIPGFVLEPIGQDVAAPFVATSSLHSRAPPPTAPARAPPLV
jgi:hypothetical protein